MPIRKCLFLFLFVLGLGGVAYVQSPSSVTPANFTGLDVVILIDQSGSMWGHPAHPSQNDKYGHRIGQVKNIIYRLAEHVENTSFVHRVSVIDFGDTAAVAISNYEMRYNPAAPGSALRDAKSIVEHQVTAKAWVNTNTPAAIELGIKEYDKMAAASPQAGRRRVMLILTDGRANLPGIEATTLQSHIRNSAEEMKRRSIGLWIVGLNDADNYWNEGDGQFWESVTEPGQARLAETASSKIFTIVQEFVDNWLDIKSKPITGDDYECPPYLRRIVFNVNFALPRSPISISDPDGNAVALLAGGGASFPGTTARFQVDDPKPGTYKINKDPTRSYYVAVEPFSANLKRLTPASVAALDAETRIVFQASDSKGAPLVIDSQWPIKASFVITSPAGASVEVPASFEGDGKFAAKWKPSELGNYHIKLKGLITLKDGSQFDVFDAPAHVYDDQLAVNSLTPYWLRLDDPAPQRSLRVMSPDTTAKISFSLVNAKNEAVSNLAGVIQDPATWLSLQVVDKSGAPLPVPAAPLVPNAAGALETSIPVRLDWKRGEGWWRAGELNLQVVAQPNRMMGDVYLDSIQLPPEADTKRVGGDPMTVGPLDVKFSLLIQGAILLALLALVALLLWYLFMRLLPGLLIWWADSSRHRRVEIKIYNGADDPNGDYAKRYPAGTWHRFKYDRQVRVSVAGQEYVAKRFRVLRAPSADQVMMRIDYSWQSEPNKQYTVLLNKGRAERLKGLPGGEFLLALEAK